MRALALLVVAGCGGSKAIEEPLDAGADAGVPIDAMPMDVGELGADAGLDAGLTDLCSRDALVLDIGPAGCLPDGEGCLCHPTTEPRGSCAYSDNLCITWPGDIPISTCIAPCTTDADCGFSDLGQVCADVGLTTKICTSAVASRDAVCRGSRAQGQEVVGCEVGLECVLGTEPTAPTFEGRCAQRCTPSPRDPSGGCRGEYGYCNPSAIRRDDGQGGIESVPICSRGQRRQGNYCTIAEPSERCDTAPEAGALDCLMINVGPAGHGVCVEPCAIGGAPCVSSDPVFGLAVCSAYNPATPRLGFCTSGCSTFPEDCSGVGLEGLGRTCVTSLTLDPALPLAFCWDIVGPTLTETIGSWNGGALMPAVLGDPCGALPSGVTRCPDGLACVFGYCLRGCDTTDPSACATATSTAVSCYGTPTPAEPSAGLCLLP